MEKLMRCTVSFDDAEPEDFPVTALIPLAKIVMIGFSGETPTEHKRRTDKSPDTNGTTASLAKLFLQMQAARAREDSRPTLEVVLTLLSGVGREGTEIRVLRADYTEENVVRMAKLRRYVEQWLVGVDAKPIFDVNSAWVATTESLEE